VISAAVSDKQGSVTVKRANVVLDTGSTENFITSHCAKRLRLELMTAKQRLEGVGGQKLEANHMARLVVIGQDREDKVWALVIPSICGEVEQIPLSSYDVCNNSVDKTKFRVILLQSARE